MDDIIIITINMDSQKIQSVDFYAGLAAFREITYRHTKVCLPGIWKNGYAQQDIPFYQKCDYIVDSGAFQDVNKDKRLSFAEAYDRQNFIIEKVGYPPNHIVTYDFLVDEKYIGAGRKIKERVDYDTAEFYVKETIGAARYYDAQGRKDYNYIVSAQGVDPEQYYRCTSEILPYTRKDDVFGLGGFCILGMKKSLVPSALLTFQKVLPLVKDSRIKKVHIFGVSSLDILYILSGMCRNLELRLSTDTTAYSRAARFGSALNPHTGRRVYMGENVTNSWELALQNVSIFAWILKDIHNNYIYKGKPGWLSALDFNYKVSYNESLF